MGTENGNGEREALNRSRFRDLNVYSFRMEHPLRQLEPRLKSILYQAVETIDALKAALYLSVDGKPYELVTHYGFRRGLPRTLSGDDPIPGRLILAREPFFVNDPRTYPRLLETLFETDSQMILVAPIFVKGQLIGFVDMRDKRGGKEFSDADLEQVKPMLQDLFALFAAEGLFGMKSVPRGGSATNPGDFKGIISAAEKTVRHLIHQKVSLGPMLTEEEIKPVETGLHTILTLPGTVLAAFSAFGHLGNVQPVAVSGPLTDDAIEKFEGKLKAWLSRQGVEIPAEPSRTRVSLTEGNARPPVNATRLNTILSAPVKVGNMTGLVLSVGFESPPDRETQQKLATYLDQIQQTIVHSISHHSMRAMRQTAAERLLEPDFTQYPELVEHSRRVSDLAERFANYVGLPPSEVEAIRIAGYVHDVGLRLLDYENLYTKPELTAPELDIVRKHPVISAAMIARSALGPQIAEIVLYHHERPDGTGYPERLQGEAIPQSSRILGLCEAFVAMTEPNGYQPAMPESSAITQIQRMAGAQFDRELASRFLEMIGSYP